MNTAGGDTPATPGRMQGMTETNELHGDNALAELYRSRTAAVATLLDLNLHNTMSKQKVELIEKSIAGIDAAIERHLNMRPSDGVVPVAAPVP